MDQITSDVIDDSISDGVVEESVSAVLVNASDASNAVVEESVLAVVVNASDSLDGFINFVSSSSDGVVNLSEHVESIPVSNGDQITSL